MIKVYYAYPPFVRENELYRELKPLSEKVQYRLEGLRRKEDRILMLTAYFLLKNALNKSGYTCYQLQYLQYSAAGRPFFTGAPFDFNISHTEQCAAIAFSENSRVGIDIEKIKAINFNDFEIIFPGEVWNSIYASEDKTGTFYSYWTLLESVVKADGRGLPLTSASQLKIKNNNVIIEGEKWYFQHQYFDHSISCCIASEKKQETVELTEVKLP